VQLNNFSHQLPQDIDVLLVGPNGQRVLLMSDAGGSNAATGVTLAFRDDATELNHNEPLVTGTFRLVNGNNDSFPHQHPVNSSLIVVYVLLHPLIAGTLSAVFWNEQLQFHVAVGATLILREIMLSAIRAGKLRPHSEGDTAIGT
jgi:hypothetical protein